MNANLKQKITGLCAGLLAGILLTALTAVPLYAQNRVFFSTGAPPPGAPKGFTTAAGASFGLVINGLDIGTILLNAADADQDGKVTPTELKTAIAIEFKQWDTNADGSLSVDELSVALKKLFPAPPPGAQTAVLLVNGTRTELSSDEIPKPDQQTVKHIFADADTNQDGTLNLTKLNDWVDKNFSNWDQNSDGTLDASELNAAFGQLARPD